MKIGPKYKLARRLGPEIFEKTQGEKFALSEARKKKGQRGRRRRLSNYGIQLIQKQRVRFTYGISEKQFRGYVKESEQQGSGRPADVLYQLLEKRLDNAVYRMGLATTRRAARQLVAHGHIVIGGKKITSPSHRVEKGTVISVREGSRNSVLFADLSERLAERELAPWLTFDAQSLTGKVVGEPARPSVGLPFDLAAVLEFYSR